jgi:hypothetical protein
MTIAIAHRDRDGRGVLDAVRERRPPFSPDDVVVEFSELLKGYGIRTVTGDRYGGQWPSERFRAHGIEYAPSEKSKSDIYRDLLPLLNSGKIELLDLPQLATQLVGLERRTARSGKDSIDHAPGAHDDVANSVSGALLLANTAPHALWRQEAFFIDGAPALMPARADVTFAVLMAGQRGDAALFRIDRAGWPSGADNGRLAGGPTVSSHLPRRCRSPPRTCPDDQGCITFPATD